jgi:hypothetical protein
MGVPQAVSVTLDAELENAKYVADASRTILQLLAKTILF